MQTQEIDRFEIGLRESGADVEIFLISAQGGLRAKASVNRKSRRLALLDAGSIPTPTDHVLLGDGAVDLTKYFNRGICANNPAEMVILDAAYMFVLNNDAPNYDEPSVDTDDYDIILRARSDIQVAKPGATPGAGNGGGGSASSPVSKGPRKPKRRKNQINVWI